MRRVYLVTVPLVLVLSSLVWATRHKSFARELLRGDDSEETEEIVLADGGAPPIGEEPDPVKARTELSPASISEATSGGWGPPQHSKLELTRIRDGLELYNPHHALGATVKGSSHTHAAPDHSGIDAGQQEERLRTLKGQNAHDFVWLTAHNFVAPSPNVPGILHMFGVEVYAKERSGSAPHVLGLLPNGRLANVSDRPFGYYSKDVRGTADAIRAAGGLPVLAHPMRYPLADAEAKALDERLWGVEILSGSTRVEDNVEFLDERLSAGTYMCLTAGGDIHDEDWSLTRGYLVVSVPKKPATMADVFESVKACNFFACGVKDDDGVPVDPPELVVSEGKITLSVPTAATLRFVGQGGKVLSEHKKARRAEYAPRGDERYVRAEAVGTHARCYSQPLWLVGK